MNIIIKISIINSEFILKIFIPYIRKNFIILISTLIRSYNKLLKKSKKNDFNSYSHSKFKIRTIHKLSY